MRSLVYSHKSSDLHDAGFGHPERPERIGAVLAGVARSGVDVEDRSPPAASPALLQTVHDPAYVAAIRDFCAAGGGAIDADTGAVAGSWEAALRAAGAGPAAIAELRTGAADMAFLALRPPGHHALRNRAMGFCLFNNIAIAAAVLCDEGERVAIVDWDVHHGNGTQTMFYDRSDVLYLSFHEFPAYPGGGWLTETGTGANSGANVNFPFPSGSGGGAYRLAMETVVVPVLRQFAPDWILVSAGYDAHVADPLASIRLIEDDYRYLAARVAGQVAPGRLILFLEGGYDLAALEGSVAATLQGIAEPIAGQPGLDVNAVGVSAAARQIIDLTAAQVGRFWVLG